ncbi:MAG: redoxin domain-containing protein [Ignavibacteriales bacterium]|nr:redoxin domain-containing protein [Ignavibacteriales bacterium]
MFKNKKIGWIQLLSIVVNIFLLVEVVVLALQNRALRSQMSTLSKIITPDPLVINDTVKSFFYQKIDGNIDTIRYHPNGKSILLFVYSITCPYCEKNWSLWEDIYNKVKNKNLNVLRLSINTIERTKEHLLKKQTDDLRTGSVAVDTTFRRSYKISNVPQTIYINQNGVIEGVWVGELKPDQKQEILKRCLKSIDINN